MRKRKIAILAGMMVMLMSVTVSASTLKTTVALNMRTGPSTRHSRMLVLPRGAKVDEISSAANGWKQVRYNGRVGFVSGQYVVKDVSPTTKVVASAAAKRTTVRANAPLNMRSTSNTSGRILLTLPRNATAEYIGTAKNGWYNVRYNGRVGFVSNQYSTLINPVVSPPKTNTPAPKPVKKEPVSPVQDKQLKQVTLYYTTETLNMRNGAGVKNSVVGTIPKGTHLQSIGTSSGWHKVTYAGKTGWVSGSYLGKGEVWMKDGVIVANKGHGMSSTFNPGENPEARTKLNQFISAGNKAGHRMSIFSGYRSYSYQRTLYNNYVKRDGVAEADTYSARPGHSEHQTGLAFDIGAAGYTTSTKLGSTSSGKWMAANAHKYGFVLSYPEGKTSVTGYQYEPWHFRYVGVDMATKVYQSGKTLDEYLGTVAPNYK